MKLGEVFQNMDGSASARRVVGVVLVVVGLVGWFLRLSDTVALSVIGLGGTLIGLTTADPHPPA